MNRMAKGSLAVCFAAILGVAVMAPISSGQSGSSPLVPPQSHAFGKSFEEWNRLQTQFAIAAGLGGQTNLSNTVRGVRLFPAAFGTDPLVEFNIRMLPGTPFVASPLFIFGERYDDPNVPDDDPDNPALVSFIEESFAAAEIQILLDNRVVLEGSGAELKKFRFGPVNFDEPIVYAEPQNRGENLNAVAALWGVGFGAVYHPLPVGRHTLVYNIQSDFPGTFTFIYHITVSPK